MQTSKAKITSSDLASRLDRFHITETYLNNKHEYGINCQIKIDSIAMQQPNISIVIPFYNESKRLSNHLALLSRYLSNRFDIEIYYVDDGSTDGTLLKLQEELTKLKNQQSCAQLLFHFHSYTPNRGKGNAVKEGMVRASGKYIFFTDFDFSISLSEIDKFVEKAKGMGPRAVVVASRKENSVVLQRQTLLRRFMGRIFNKIMKLIINLPVKDTQCGFKLFDHETARLIFPKLMTKGFAFDVEVLKTAQLNGIPIAECGVEISHDDINSTVNIYLDPLRMICDLLKLRWRLFLDRKHYLVK